MKEKLWLLILFFIGSSFFAFSQNNQTVIPASSIVYEYLSVILAEQGEVPSIIERPASKDRILDVLEAADYNKLSSSAKFIYSELLDELKSAPLFREQEKLAVDLSLDINIESYLQTDYDHVDWVQSESERLDFITIPLEWWIFDSLYGRVDFLAAKDQFLYEQVPAHDGYWSNVPVNTSQIDFQFPYVAYLAAGGSHWNMQVGRDTLSYGSGRSGNLLISGNLPYYSFFRAKTFWDAFSYSYTAIDPEPWSIDTDPGSETIGEFIRVQKTLISHGFTFNFIPRVSIGFKESSMLSEFDPGLNYLNPFMIFHNYYIGGFNSFLTLNFEVNVWKGINFYGVLAIDQIQTSYEINRYDATAIPNAYGYLLGTEISVPHSDGYWLGNVEWVYTNPWLYIHEDSHASFIWTGQIVSNVDGRYFKQLPFGYPAGPDCMNLFASLGYTKLQRYSLEGGYTLQVKGSQNIADTLWSDIEGAAALQTPTGTAETTHSIWIDAAWFPSFYTHVKEIGTGLAYLFLRNEDNIQGEDYHDFQWSFHISLNY